MTYSNDIYTAIDRILMLAGKRWVGYEVLRRHASLYLKRKINVLDIICSLQAMTFLGFVTKKELKNPEGRFDGYGYYLTAHILNKFPCTACGVCCTELDVTNERPPDLYRPFGTTDGVCDMYKDQLCMCYNERPLICNLDALIEYHGWPKAITYKAVSHMCNDRITKHGLDKKYYINL